MEEATWVGIKEGEERLAAIGLRTGSRSDRQLETTASIERGWGIAVGAAACTIVRAEGRADDETTGSVLVSR